MALNIAFNYSARTELIDAMRSLMAAGVPPAEVDETMVTDRLYTAGQPDVDLVIRTGGEQRMSNFLLWQGAYAELVFCPALWPDFTEADLVAALAEFTNRQRRFGS
jgi:undecaprenyl diphosphate synthase